jgi:DNA replication protein DnaC
MSLTQVRLQMEKLGFLGMLGSVEDVLLRLQRGDVSGIEALNELLEHERSHRSIRATQGRILRSKIRKGAALEDFDFTLKRSITRADIKELARLEWCDEGKPLILIGPTGVGKTFIARSLGLLACERGKTTLFMSTTEFLETQSLSRQCGGYLKFRDRLTRPDVLLIDDMGMRKFTAQEAEDLRDIVEQRSYGKSTVITTQLPFDHWSEVIGDEIIRDALIDRLEPQGVVIKIKGPSFRKRNQKEGKVQTDKERERDSQSEIAPPIEIIESGQLQEQPNGSA